MIRAINLTPPLAVDPVPTALQEVEARIRATLGANQALLEQYHQLWYEAVAHTWGFTHFLGVGILKCPNDLWAYQDIMMRVRPRTVLEMGTFQGGSAMWFAYLMDMLGIDGNVYSVDIQQQAQAKHPRATFISGSSTDPKIAKMLISKIKYPLLVVLDSDHSEKHVRNEMDLYAPACKIGDRLVVEDTNISWPHDKGARGALESYLKDHPNEFRQDLLSERWLLTMHPGGWLERVAEPKKKTNGHRRRARR